MWQADCFSIFFFCFFLGGIVRGKKQKKNIEIHGVKWNEENKRQENQKKIMNFCPITI